jgi:predicted nucleic acid-binding protein
MSRVLFIDSGPLGFALTPATNDEHLRCSQWLEAMILQGEQIAIAEIVDYECRRGWLRHDNLPALEKLDQARAGLIYVPISTEAMLQAAALWAAARKGGYATTTDQRLDADVILAAQVITFECGGADVLIATTNVKHLARSTPAEHWESIT